MPSLRREEAQARAALISVDAMHVDLDLTRGEEVFGSTARIRFTRAESGGPAAGDSARSAVGAPTIDAAGGGTAVNATDAANATATPTEATAAALDPATFFEIVPQRLRRVVLNGTELPVDGLRDNRFALPGLAADNELIVEADMAYSHSGEGLHRFTDPEDGLVYTYMMGFHDMASRVFACFEQPDLKAPLTLTVTAPEGWTVVANGRGDQVRPGRWEFAETHPVATYFTTFVAGPYHSVYREYDGVRFGLHCRRSMARFLDVDVEEIYEITFGCFDRFHELYGVRYAFGDTYDQAFVPEFNAGAMENPGCVTFRDEAFVFRSAVTETRRQARATVIAHEMAHMWFGDLVTLRWWDDLWLNESFANYMGFRGAAEATRFEGGWARLVFNKIVGYAADERPSTHPVSCELEVSADALANFDGIAYSKGGAILKQLAAWLGDDVFFGGLREYFSRYGYGNASLADLLDCLSQVSGHDLAEWGRVWLRTCAPNTLRAEVEADAAGLITAAAIEQTAPAEHPTLRPHFLKLGLYDRDGDRFVRTRQVTVHVDGPRTEVPELVGLPRPALLLVNDDDVTYAKVRLDPVSLAAAREALPRLDDHVARSLLWSIVWDACRDGELDPAEYVSLLVEALPSEPLLSVVEQLLLTARRTVIGQFLPAGRREEALRALSGLGARLREGAEPGGGRQLAGVRLEVSVATADDVDRLRGWLDGRDVPEGLAVDAELRWLILERLCALGAASGADVDAELTADPSSEGVKNAAKCRAALPDADAKEEAWRTVLYDTDLSNHVLRATAEGFWQGGQEDLLLPYVERFFAEFPDAVAKRMPWETMHLTAAMYPSSAVSAATVERTRALLAGTGLSAELRRGLTDQADDVARAVRVREAADRV